MARPAVLMSDPRYFEIRGGANPHTRDAEGRRKRVERNRALDQWHSYADALQSAGVDVYVVPPKPSLSGMVFAANAGFLYRRPERTELRNKVFFPSHFTAEHRRAEADQFERFMDRMGCQTEEYPEELRFEGEADAFPVADEWVFTHGFRSDRGVKDWLESRTDLPFHSFELSNPEYYHGDCLLCDLGDDALGWPGGLVSEDGDQLRALFGDRLIEVSDEQARTFVGNSFYVETDADRLLFTVDDIPDELARRVTDRGIEVIRVDVSEMFGKGGGGPKCMVFHLGRVLREDPHSEEEINRFRRNHRIDRMRTAGEIPMPN